MEIFVKCRLQTRTRAYRMDRLTPSNLALPSLRRCLVQRNFLLGSLGVDLLLHLRFFEPGRGE